jgi:hypothetical protein
MKNGIKKNKMVAASKTQVVRAKEHTTNLKQEMKKKRHMKKTT